MLVLSRERDESVMIGDEIEVTVVDIRGNKVRLGTRAPASRYAIFRRELYEEVVAQIRGGEAYRPRAKHDGGMLVVSRLRDQQLLVIDVEEFEALLLDRQHNIAVTASVTLVDIRGDKLRLVFTVDPQLQVHRKEVFEAIRREKRATAYQPG